MSCLFFEKIFWCFKLEGCSYQDTEIKRDEGSSSNETHENNQITCRCKAFLVSFLSYMWDRLNKRFVTYELCAWYKVVQKYARTLHMPKRHLLQLLLILRVHESRLLMTISFLYRIQSFSNKIKLWLYYCDLLISIPYNLCSLHHQKGFCVQTASN